MGNQSWVERFSADVDRLFKAGTPADSAERTPAEYSELLALAQTLSSTDFSDQSQIQPALRRRLLTSMDTREGWHLREGISMFNLFRKRRLALVLPTVAVILASLMIVSLAWPGGLTAAAQGIIELVQRLSVGEHTSIEPLDSEQFPEGCKVVRLDDRLVKSAANGDRAQCRQVGNVAEAQADVPFTLRQPGYLPKGYTFGGANVLGSGDLVTVDLYYNGPGGVKPCGVGEGNAVRGDRVMLSQSPVGEQPDQAVSIGLPGVWAIETAQVNGHFATWAQGTLLWEADGISYLLTGCTDLGLVEAVRVAESLE